MAAELRSRVADPTMETMPYQFGMEDAIDTATLEPTSGWRAGLPALAGAGVTVRELRASDASSLYALLTTEEVARFISPPPKTVQAFEQFIMWSHIRRAQGHYVCFGIVPDGEDAAVGIIQIQLTADEPPEWGFVMGSPFWGTGLFVEAATAVLDFAFRHMGLEQLAARAGVDNGRGNGALRKVGAVRKEFIANGFVGNGCVRAQYYWTVTRADRSQRKITWDLATH